MTTIIEQIQKEIDNAPEKISLILQNQYADMHNKYIASLDKFLKEIKDLKNDPWRTN